MFALRESFKLKLRDIFRGDADCDLQWRKVLYGGIF